MSLDTWKIVQKNIAAIHQEKGLSTALHSLYQQQIDTGYLAKNLIKDISHIIPIYHPNDSSRYFNLQLNPTRVNRGVATRQHPNPSHTIAFKGGIPCFLCRDTIEYQWPTERGYQLSINGQDLVFLPNVSPIYPCHFTIASIAHKPQFLDVKTLLKIARHLPDFWIVQNDAGAGATNPEHYHLQCFKTDRIPLTNAPSEIVTSLKIGDHHLNTSIITHDASVYKFEIEGNESDDKISRIITSFHALNKHHRMNILARKRSNKFIDIYCVLRHTERRTNLYKSGQPGYAEASGIISAPNDEKFESWKRDGWALYSTLLSAIQIPQESHNLWMRKLESFKTRF